MKQARLDSLFSALGDPTRRLIVERLARGSLTISEASAGIRLSQPAISKHVKVLERSGLVRREVSWRAHRLHLAPGAMQAASSWIAAQQRFWDAALARLDAHLMTTSYRKKKKGRRS